MRKKILIIGICLVVVLVLVVGGGIFIIKGGYKYLPLIITGGTGVPTYVANQILPPPNLKNKSMENQKDIVKKILIEETQAEASYQFLKVLELNIKIVKLGTPIVPVLMELFQDENLGEEKVKAGAYTLTNESIVRLGSIEMLNGIISAKVIPLEQKLKEEEDYQNPFWQSYWKRYYKYAKRIEVDMDKIVSELIKVFKNRDNEEIRKRVIERNRMEGILDNCDIVKLRIKEILITILKRTNDRRIAEALDRDGTDYRVWVWTDETGRDKAIKIAMEVLKGNYTPCLTFEEKTKLEESARKKEEERVDKKIYAIRVLGDAKAKEAVPMLIEMLEKEIEKRNFYGIMGDIITALGKIGTDEAVNMLIKIYKQLGGGRCFIEALGESRNKKAISFLEDIAKSNDKYDEKGYETDAGFASEALKKITGKEYKYKR